MITLAEAVKEEALRLGFMAAGIASASALQNRQEKLTQWIAAGSAGSLGYMENFLERQGQLLTRFRDLKSILVVAASYSSEKTDGATSVSAGRIARYARGRDYHKTIHKRLQQLEAFLRQQTDQPLQTIRTVDTAPVQERVLAEAAGLGFFGKNTCLIAPRGGSFVFLGALLTNLELPADEPIRWDCGACTLCLEACPTGALTEAYHLDAKRCISYLTIELKGEIEPSLRPLVHNWLFGCDICQEVCPYNRKTAQSPWEEFRPVEGAGENFPLKEILSLRSQEDFLSRFAGTPLTRPKREGLLRNAAVVAGNLKNPQLVPDLAAALASDSSPIVRSHSAWALGQIGTQEALKALSQALQDETDQGVRNEIEAALRGLTPA